MGGTATGAQAAAVPAGPADSGWDAAASPAAGGPIDSAWNPGAQTPPSAPAAPPAGAAPGSTPAALENATTSATIPSQAAPQYQAQPVVVTSQKAPGILGVVDSIADALVGKTKPEIGTDAQGNQYVKQQTLSRGQQWVRIGAGVVGGAAKGFAAGKGRNPGAAAAAGFDQGQQQAQQRNQQQKDMSDQAQKQMLANANYQKLRMDTAEQSWHLTAMQHEASDHDVAFAQGQEDRLMKVDGATLLGTAANPNDIDKILKVDPDVMKSMIQNHQIEILPHYNPDGTAAGIRVFKMPDGYRKTIEPAGTVFHTFDSTTGQYAEHKSSEPLTAGEVDDYETAASNAAQKFKLDQANLAQKQAQTEEAKANAGKANAEATKVPSEIADTKARADASEASAAKDRAISGTGEGGSSLVDSIGTGKIALDRLGYLAARNPELLAAVQQKYPDFDSSKAASYPAVYKEFTSSKKGTAGAALNAGGTALKHLQELQQLNTIGSHIPGTSAYTAYQNKADTLSTELASFYGDTTIPAIAAIKSTLTSQVPGGRNAAIRTQAQSMGDKFNSYQQTWDNAAPSKAYEAPMPQIDQEAKEARAALDPRYHAQLVAEQQGAPPPSKQVQPPALPANAAPPAQGMSRIWAPGSPTWKDVPTNQVPKNVPGLVVR
jgi:hypothetical protein